MRATAGSPHARQRMARQIGVHHSERVYNSENMSQARKAKRRDRRSPRKLFGPCGLVAVLRLECAERTHGQPASLRRTVDGGRWRASSRLDSRRHDDSAD
ncbi:hypothetical protein MTO96_001768 [Rhipicephalus appendiculatus]